MKLRTGLWSAFGLLALLCPRSEAQTVYGPGGLFVHASAFVPPAHTFRLNVSYFQIDEPGEPLSHWIPISATYSLSVRAEVGGIFLDRIDHDRARSSGGLYGKFQIVPDAQHHPAAAIVGNFIAGDVRQSSVTFALSHQFQHNDRSLLTLHGGLQWARRNDLPRSSDGFSGYVGANVPLGREFQLTGELGTRFSFDRAATSAIGVQWTARGGATVGVGYVNIGRARNNGFFVGVGYPLSGSGHGGTK